MIESRDPIQELLITARRNQILDAATRVWGLWRNGTEKWFKQKQ